MTLLREATPPAGPLTARGARALCGTVSVPGDKSISHRALILGALAIGQTRITGLLESEDVLNTAGALAALGARVQRHDDGHWTVQGLGVGGWREPDRVLDHGNSGTGVRLLMGAVATTPLIATFTGDASLCRRPMGRVLEPLARFGAETLGRSGGRLPLTLRGAADPVPVTYRLPVPSAQVKSAVLLAGLNAPGETRVIEAEPTRDHTERMLVHFGAEIKSGREGSAHIVSVAGDADLRAAPVVVPADPSSAAFPLVAALLVPGSDLLLPGVLMNETRTGLLETLIEMGADLSIENRRDLGGEPVADLRVRHAPLRGVRVPAGRAPRMIDEYPVLAVAAACADGRTVMEGLGELRVKESDRLSGIADGLARCGVRVSVDGDTLTVDGLAPGARLAPATIETRLDHRLAMSFLVLGLAGRGAVRVDDIAMIATSFPGFVPGLAGLGADFGEDPA